MSELKRYARQMRVAEVGRENQQNLRSANVIVRGDDLSASVEALYLAGAGIGHVRMSESIAADVAQINSDIVVDVGSENSERASERRMDARVLDLDPAAALVASGSLAALSKLKEIFARS